jgi:two-component system chemotaxis response regulator CheY
MTVLIVDDDGAIRELLHRLLVRDFGVDVVQASNGLEALPQLLACRVDLVILDLAMHGMGGIETLEAIRRSPAYARLPVVVFSGHADEGRVLRASQLGVIAFLAKPIKIGPLRERLAPIVSSVRAEIANKSEKSALELNPAQRVLILDEAAEFRAFFRDRLRETCQVDEAEDEASAIRLCVDTFFEAVFVGTTTDPIHISRLREALTRAGRQTLPRMVGVVATADLQAARDQGIYNDVVVRSLEPETFDRSLSEIVGDRTRARLLFSGASTAAAALFERARQKAQKLLRCPVTLEAPQPFPNTLDRWVSGAVELQGAGLAWQVRARCPFAAALELSSAWLELDNDQVAEAQILEVAGLLANELAVGLFAHVSQQGIATTMSAPRVSLTRANALARSEVVRSGSARWLRTARHEPALVVQLSSVVARPA